MQKDNRRLRSEVGTMIAAGLMAVLLSCSEDPVSPSALGQPDPQVGVAYSLVSVDDLALPQVIELVDTQRIVS